MNTLVMPQLIIRYLSILTLKPPGHPGQHQNTVEPQLEYHRITTELLLNYHWSIDKPPSEHCRNPNY
jgi:hypothetical protein